MKNHTFAICAYGESPYLEECIRSTLDQTEKSQIIISTSTPLDHIHNLAQKYNLQLFINPKSEGIAGDWNFAYDCAKTRYVTITHQDDIYEKHYAEYLRKCAKIAPNMLIFFTDYGEIRDNKMVDENRLLRIKRLMLAPLKTSILWSNRFVRRRILSFGSAICCPSVTFDKRQVGKAPFIEQYRSDEDWQAWEKLSRKKGQFCYCPYILMRHRIHVESETTDILNAGIRREEDYEMLCKFWPEGIAKIIAKYYAKSEESNQM